MRGLGKRAAVAAIGAVVAAGSWATAAHASVLTVAATLQDGGAQDATAVDPDPAAERLQLISYSLVGLAVLIIVMTVIYWVMTRPVRVTSGDLAGQAPAVGGSSTEGASIDLTEAPEPTGPRVDAPLPNPAALTPPPAAVPAAAPAPAGAAAAAAPAPAPAGAAALAPAPAAAAAALTSALAAIPDMTPTMIRFDDPPVQRVGRQLPAPGAPNFEQAARDNTARREAVASARRADQRPPRTLRTAQPDPDRPRPDPSRRRRQDSPRAVADGEILDRPTETVRLEPPDGNR